MSDHNDFANLIWQIAVGGATRRQLAEVLGITTDGVKYHLRKLQEQGRLRRIGSDKGGRWKVEPE